MKQDIRIVQFQNLSQFSDFEQFQDHHKQGGRGCRVFSYFDQIMVNPCGFKLADHLFATSYQSTLQLSRELSRESNRYRSQHLLLAFMEYPDDQVTNDKIRKFWQDYDQAALFFVTMVNISSKGSLKSTIDRINHFFEKQDYLVYTSFEHNELFIFCKGRRFDQYSQCVMNLNYSVVENIPNYVQDTITICGFGKEAEEVDEETFDAYIGLGTNNYEQATAFLNQFQDESNGRKWLLGRNDVAALLIDSNLKQLYGVYQKCLTKERKAEDKNGEEKKNWILTVNLSVLITPVNEDSLNGTTSLVLDQKKEQFFPEEKLTAKVDELEAAYNKACKVLSINIDKVFLRILHNIKNMLCDCQTIQMAKDLIACLLPQFWDFINYMIICCERIREKRQIVMLHGFINTFYLNVSILINSTVHSDRQFIQIPHCEGSSFEMPSKIIAYYMIMSRCIASILKDEENVFYGIMLSPKLVDELEVESPLICQETEPDQLISINISEKMMYQPLRTVTILAHEIAHYVGNQIRRRDVRWRCIFSYYINQTLQNVLEEYRVQLYSDCTETLGDVLSAKKLKEFSDRMCNELFPVPKKTEDTYKWKIRDSIIKIPRRLLQGRSVQISNELLFPKNSVPLFEKALRCSISTRINSLNLEDNDCVKQMLKSYGEECFIFTLEQFMKKVYDKTANDTLEHFDNVTGYLFSESYADLCMILLFDLKPENYTTLFAEGIQDSALEAARFIAVARALHLEGVWKNIAPKADCDETGKSWPEKLEINISLCLNDDQEVNYKRQLEKSSYKFNLLLLSYLIEYLRECIKSIEEQFKTSQNAKKITQLRTNYSQTNPDKSALQALETILRMENENLKLDNI